MRRVLEAEFFDDVFAGGGIRRGGEGDARHAREAANQLGELHVMRAEIVAPLGDAVGLVDREQGDGRVVEEVQEFVHQEPLGGDVDEVDLAVADGGFGGGYLARVDVRVDRSGADAKLLQSRNLVLHQRNQRRDDDRDARTAEGGDLIAQRLTGAGRHQHKRVLARDYRVDRGLLMPAEARIAVGFLEDMQRRGMGHGKRLEELLPSFQRKLE